MTIRAREIRKCDTILRKNREGEKKTYLVDDVDDWLPSVDGERTPLPVLDCPLSVDLRAEDDVGVLPGVSLGMRLGVVESKTRVNKS